MTNNIGQMTEALGFDPDLTSASLALFSAAQAASRVMTGSISESALKWKLPWYCGCITGNGNRRRRGDDGVHGGSRGLPRPAFLVVASLISALSHSILSVATTEEGFAFGVTMSGVAFGMVWPLMVRFQRCKSSSPLSCRHFKFLPLQYPSLFSSFLALFFRY